MMREHDICEILSDLLPSGRLNDCFESDAEIIQLHGEQTLFSMDEFSGEDLFCESDPYGLGWNVAAGAISDILACGGLPRFYAHALTISPEWDHSYLEKFGAGVRDVLLRTAARFMGGDCGLSREWRCTASVIGSCEGVPVRRSGAAPEDTIYLTGPVGAGNLQAASRLLSREGKDEGGLRLPIRLREAAIMRRYASACMDTSDGAWCALKTLAEINGCGFAVENVPYAPHAVEFCSRAGLPKELLFLGECGEYELLFTVENEKEPWFELTARNSKCEFFRLGRMTDTGLRLSDGEEWLNLDELKFQARDFSHPAEYVAALTTWLGERHVEAGLVTSGKE